MNDVYQPPCYRNVSLRTTLAKLAFLWAERNETPGINYSFDLRRI